MSMWCRVCGKTTFNEELCDHCGKIPKEQAKEYKVPPNKGARIIKGVPNNNKSYMTPCEVCQNDIAVKATSCPHCGDTKSKNLFWKIIKIMAIILGVLAILEIILMSVGFAIIGSAAQEVTKQNQEMIRNLPKLTMPKIDFGRSQRELKKQNRINKERKRRIIQKNKKREEEKAKRKLYKEMGY